MALTTVAVLVGSLRADSIHRRLAEVAADVVPENVAVRLVDGLGELPLYNEDVDLAGAPEAVERLRRRLTDADAIALFTPANNGTVSAALKNAIDWASRPYGRSSFSGKPVAAVSAAHNTSTIIDHTLLAASVAGGVPVSEATATFALRDLAGVDLATDARVRAELRRSLAGLVEKVPTSVAA
jgi:NAD(P)H-dependent FMN reductase